MQSQVFNCLQKNHLTCKCYNFYDLSHFDTMFDNANLLMGKLQLVKGWPMGKEIIPQISFTFIKGGSWQIAVNSDTENSSAKSLHSVNFALLVHQDFQVWYRQVHALVLYLFCFSGQAFYISKKKNSFVIQYLVG